MENQDTIAICVLSFPIALVLRYILQALKCWEPTSWVKDLPAFASLEKVAISQDGIASQHKTAESPFQSLILVNKRIHDLHEVERYYEGCMERSFTKVTDQTDQVILRDLIVGFLKDPKSVLDRRKHQQLINQLAEADGRCDETPVKLEQHLVKAGYLRVGLAGLD